MLLGGDFARKMFPAKASRLNHRRVQQAVFCRLKNIHGQFKTIHLRSLRLNKLTDVLIFCLNDGV